MSQSESNIFMIKNNEIIAMKSLSKSLIKAMPSGTNASKEPQGLVSTRLLRHHHKRLCNDLFGHGYKASNTDSP